MIGTFWHAKREAGWVGPEGRGNGREIGGRDGLWIVAVNLVEILLQGIIDSIDGGFAGFVAGGSV